MQSTPPSCDTQTDGGDFFKQQISSGRPMFAEVRRWTEHEKPSAILILRDGPNQISLLTMCFQLPPQQMISISL